MSLLSRYPLREPPPGRGPERPSFEDIYQSSAGWVWDLLRRLGVPERDRDDVAHEVFSAVLSRLPDYEPRQKLRGWLGTITYYIALRHRALAWNQRVALMGTTDHETHSDPSSSPEEQALERQRALALLDALEPDRWIVFVRHELQGTTMDEVARELGIPYETAKNRLRLARRDLDAVSLRLDARDRSAAAGLGALGLIPLAPDAFFAQGSDAAPLPEAAKDALWKRLLRTHGATALGGGVGSAALSAGGALTLAGTGAVLKLGAAGVAAFLLGFGVRGVVDRASAPGVEPTAMRVASTPAAPEESVALVDPRPSEQTAALPTAASATADPAGPGAAGAAKHPLEVASAEAGATDKTEGDLVKRAKVALAAGNADEALRLVDRHARQFPRGSMGAEREMIAVQALLRAGRRAQAEQRADDFRARFPRSPFLSTLDAVLAPQAGTP